MIGIGIRNAFTRGAGSALWTPLDSAPLLVLESDVGVTDASGAASQWVDQVSGLVLEQTASTSFRPAIDSTVTLGGIQSLRFDGTNDRLQTSGTANPAFNCLHNGLGVTIVALFNGDSGTSSNRGQIIGTYNTSGANDIGGGLRYEPDNQGLNYVGGNGSAVTWNARSASSTVPHSSVSLVRAEVAVSTTPDFRSWLAGSALAGGTSLNALATPTESNTGGRLSVGSTPGGSVFLRGNLWAVYVWPRLLSAESVTLANLKAYLDRKYSQSFSAV